MPSTLPPLPKAPHQLLYLVYGEQDVYRREAKFSILTALSQLKQGESLCIRVMTDRPQDYTGWPVETIALDEQTLTRWQGGNGYTHRRKACAIAHGLTLADKTLFVDTDTLFLKSPHRVLELIEPGQYVMDEFEYDWSYVCKRPDYLKLGRDLQAHGISASNGFKLYNSGLCGVQASDAPLLETAIGLIDEWTRESFDIHTIEQVAISFAMRGKPVREARKFVHHFYADKRFFHAMQAHFFSLHGETFSPELIARSQDVPCFKPMPSPLQRFWIKWQLRNQRKHLKKVVQAAPLGAATVLLGQALAQEGQDGLLVSRLGGPGHVLRPTGVFRLQQLSLLSLVPTSYLLAGRFPPAVSAYVVVRVLRR